jgi:hypothetical protein
MLIAGLVVMPSGLVLADSPQLQSEVAALKASMQNNKVKLAQYTWQQLETVSVNGDVKKQTQYLVQIGPNGKPQKTDETASAPQGRNGLIKRHMEKNYEDYAAQIAALAQSYAQSDPGKLQQLYQQGQVTLGSGGVPGVFALVIHNYVKQGDTVTIVFNKPQQAMVSASVASYLSAPSDAVAIKAQYGQLGDGTNYVQKLTVNGESKNLAVVEANSNFQHK